MLGKRNESMIGKLIGNATHVSIVNKVAVFKLIEEYMGEQIDLQLVSVVDNHIVGFKSTHIQRHIKHSRPYYKIVSYCELGTPRRELVINEDKEYLVNIKFTEILGKRVSIEITLLGEVDGFGNTFRINIVI